MTAIYIAEQFKHFKQGQELHYTHTHTQKALLTDDSQ